MAGNRLKVNNNKLKLFWLDPVKRSPCHNHLRAGSHAISIKSHVTNFGIYSASTPSMMKHIDHIIMQHISRSEE